ncbi:Hypothetical Protein FCC1311_080342 [Hondaea fermentalgiana]|uniref:Uncharacterized protein n=1 Tax=Hondaea fermentalgiana TaxID=2315210 RepID=A0A2R5GNC9_9STRA|nr:Hypothetical Protein FCC1311_080342 [Hondaea fermentalgiana]|eukprot:GBG31809.1 Hypothetical Protein FCC1311_080342 [Hondaea fermentalgiana]
MATAGFSVEAGPGEGSSPRPTGSGRAAVLGVGAWERAGTAGQPLAEPDGNTMTASAGSLDDYMALKMQAGVLEASCVSGPDEAATCNTVTAIPSAFIANDGLGAISIMIESLPEAD